ncbi:hypothetical protein [Streptomyces guryensis]|uniref:Uncharacterized protein n=1 Tax=Streptomyces guryensis TaxID=2886947 RepID=A0A9Q3Z5Y0_9ACTN|nr:hypothetical protein [Streptomyces guryensis]MCD9876266.1 hypothetical protein [Streptomyces guryensis]
MTDLQDDQQSLSPELQEEVSGVSMSLVAAMASGLSPEKAMAELHGRFKEILKREGLSPWEIAYLRGKIEKWPPGYAEEWASGYAEGRAAARAEVILSALEARGVAVTVNVRERITSCTDLDTLALWCDRSLTITTAEDLFREGAEAPQE